MLNTNSIYTFTRRADGSTSSVSVQVSIYNVDTVPTKKYWSKDARERDTEIDIPDYSSLTPLETRQFSYSIPDALSTTAEEVDRSSNADAPLNIFHKNLVDIKNNTKDHSTYSALWDKYQPSHGLSTFVVD